MKPGLPAPARTLPRSLARTMTHTLAAELRQAAIDAPDQPFIRFVHGEWTFGAVDRGTDALAAGLYAQGVRQGHNVSLMLPNGIEFALAWFALAKLGAVAAPVNTSFKGQVLANAIDLVQSTLLIVHASLWPQLAEIRQQLETVRHIVLVGEVQDADPALLPWTALQDAGHPAPPPVQAGFSDLALLLYTSGTTGRSKAAMISNRFVLRQAEVFIEGLRLRPDDVLYCPYPMFHLDAAVMTIAPALLLRGVAAIGERFSVSRYWDEMRAMRATVFDFMGATLTMLWKQAPSPNDRTHSARLGWGVPLPAWATEFEARFGCRLVELYGATEVGGLLFTPQDAPPRPGSCGLPVGPWTVRLVDEDGFTVAPGTPGELVVRSEEPSVLMDGYWGMPEATIAAFRNQWFHTGDLLRQDADGWFYFVGRRKDIVRRRGENISAAEVEMGIEAHPGVLACAVVGVPSDMTEEEVMACVVLRPGTVLSPRELTYWCASKMAKFMVPRYVRFTESLPKTPTDKVEKFRLQQRGTDGAWDREAPGP
ncbi:MAG: ATP-dependent acyl-CoA ligase [Rhodoferax sp.]|nr:ATP-dependent acyl-CoA ligase [Rhodoferax sp.]